MAMAYSLEKLGKKPLISVTERSLILTMHRLDVPANQIIMLGLSIFPATSVKVVERM